MPRYEINNLFPIVKDVGNGKQPLGTLFDTQNLVPIKKTGSLTSRNGYTTGLSAPSGLVTLDRHLTFPVTFPTSIDYHLYFYQAAAAAKHITVKPYYHNGSSAGSDNNGWVDIADKVTFTVNAGFLADITINGSTTNTFVLADASDYGLSTTANFYKNWTLCLTSNMFGGSTPNAYLIIAYSVTTNVATFTLDNIVDSASGIITPSTLLKSNIAEASIQRYFHGDKGRGAGQSQSSYFAPSYTSPAGYFTDTAIFFSGGAGSTVGYKNIRGGYYSKTFFNSVTANKHVFQGSYFEQAEVFKPDTSSTRDLLKSIAQASAHSSPVISNEVDRSMSSGHHWTGNGNHSVLLSSINGDSTIQLTNTGEGDSTSNNVSLANTYTSALTASAVYKIRIVYTSTTDTVLYIEINGQTLAVQLAKTPLHVIDPSTKWRKSEPRTIYEVGQAEVQFTASGTTAPTIKLWFKDISTINIIDMNVFLYSDDALTLRKGKTIKYYCVFIYDGFERSDPKYLGGVYLTIATPVVKSTLEIKLGELNKRITAIESYATIENGDTTSNTTDRVESLYFMHSIPVCDSDTGWTFNTATGCFEYIDTLDGADFDNASQTWEQRANRIESSSLTCSYNIAENCAGRIFVAQYYDYVDARFYTNTIRYTNFNKFGVMSPSVLANIDDEFVTYINAGAGTNITTLFERKGELIVGKEASVLRISADQNKTLWVPIVITNSVGVLNDFVMQSLGNTLIWTDDSGIYRWDGGEVELWGDKIWSQYYRDNKTTSQISWIDRYDGSYNLSLNSAAGNFFKMYQNVPFPYYQNLTHNVTHVAVIKDGSIYFATSAAGSYLFSTGKTDSGTPFSTYINTGTFTLANNKFCYVKEIQIDLEISGTLTGTMQFLLYADTVLLSTVNLATTTLTNVRYRPPIKPATRYQLYINYHGTPLKSTSTITFNRIAFDYDEVKLFGDASNV